MREFSNTALKVVRSAWGAVVHKRAAKEQGGLLSGKDPSAFNEEDPLRLFIIQLGIIILTTQLLALVLRKIKQPKVIAEVIGGIILGPTCFGRIPGFTQHVFPQESRPYLSLVANIGLVLFLFLVGLEIEGSVIKRNARLSFTIACAGMVLPFAFGAGISKAIYDEFVNPNTEFTHFLLFVGVSFAITAFPVLCRILTELKLLDTTVGIVVLSAGVGNDIVGWVLLALAVALVNAASGLTALWILLVAIAWTIVTLLPMRLSLHWLARKTGSIENGPSTLFMTVTILLMFGSAFFTDIIGVHPIFGGFLVGLIVPRDGGLAIAITEKLEDIVAVMLLPLYFALSGLSTDLSLLDNGITWGYVFAIIALAYLGKFGGCSLAARWAGFNWREAAAIGSLMSCKGLIELIVLNVGLSAHILDTRVFSMFVLEALVLTFMTTPAVQYYYPARFRVHVGAGNVKHANLETPREKRSLEAPSPSRAPGREHWKTRFTVVLDKLEHLPAIMTMTQLLQPEGGSRVDALRLIELSDRTSAVMRSSAADTLLETDPLIGVVRTLGELNGFAVQAALAVVPSDNFAESIDEHVQHVESELVLVSWSAPHTTHADKAEKQHVAASVGLNPLSALFGGGGENAPAVSDAAFVRRVFAGSSVDVALYIDPGHALAARNPKRRHFVLPFFGGPDDRLALELVVQLCAGSAEATASVVHLQKSDLPAEGPPAMEKPAPVFLGVGGHGHSGSENRATVTSMQGIADTMYGNVTTQTRMQSETADNVAWSRYANPSARAELPAEVQAGLARIEFSTVATPTPLAAAVQLMHDESGRRRVFGIVGRSRRLAVESHSKELAEMLGVAGSVAIGADVRKTLGDVASAVVGSDLRVGVVVVQASLASAPA